MNKESKFKEKVDRIFESTLYKIVYLVMIAGAVYGFKIFVLKEPRAMWVNIVVFLCDAFIILNSIVEVIILNEELKKDYLDASMDESLFFALLQRKEDVRKEKGYSLGIAIFFSVILIFSILSIFWRA